MNKIGIYLTDTSEKLKKQELFDELRQRFNRLYRTQAGYFSQFVRNIYNSEDLQDLFGITIPENDDDKPVKFLNDEFELIALKTWTESFGLSIKDISEVFTHLGKDAQREIVIALGLKSIVSG